MPKRMLLPISTESSVETAVSARNTTTRRAREDHAVARACERVRAAKALNNAAVCCSAGMAPGLPTLAPVLG
jgi:hypothetical protein